MTPQQIDLVQESYAKVVHLADTAGNLFYQRLFELDSSLKPLFKVNIQEQGRKLMGFISIVVSKLDHLEDMEPAIQALGERHVEYGVKVTHYDAVGQALLWTLAQCLDSLFTDEVKDAWATLYGKLASTMIEASEVAA